MPTWDIQWTPDTAAMANEFAVKTRDALGGWGTRAVVRGTSYRLELAESDELYEVAVAPIVNGVEANEEEWTVQSFRPSDDNDLPVPDDVTGFSAAVDGDNVTLSWNAVANADEYEIRKGPTFGESVVHGIVPAPKTTFVHGIHYGGVAEAWFIVAKRNGKRSANSTTTAPFARDNPYLTTVQEVDHHTAGFVDTKSNVEVDGSGDLVIKPVPNTANVATMVANTATWKAYLKHWGSGTYTTAQMDAGAVVNERPEVYIIAEANGTEPPADECAMTLRPALSAPGVDAPRGHRGPASLVRPSGAPVNGHDVLIEIDTSQTGVPTWQGFRPWQPGMFYKYRMVRFRITLTSVSWCKSPKLTTLTIKRRRMNLKDEGEVTVTGTGGTTVTFAQPFTQAPQITVSIETNAARIVTFDTLTATGMKVYVFNEAGTEQSAGQVHWHALGI